MLLLIKNADIYAPKALGKRDILLADPDGGGRILAIEEEIDAARLSLPCEILEAGGLIAVPGLIDNHVHLLGGGGEGGWATRTPELGLVDATLAGVTSLVGVLGTDGIARSLEALVAKTLALRAEGLSAWCYTGSYRLPLVSLTGDSMRDIMLVDPVIGIGEVAVSDHRSSKPSRDELARLTSEARVAGMLSGKAGIVNVHLGDAPAGLGPLREVVETGDLPPTQFLPTHCNRNPRLFAEALAWVRAGGYADFTASGIPAAARDGELSAAAALLEAKKAGVELGRLSLSSDGQGSLPVFDAEGRISGLGVGSCSSLLDSLREALGLGLRLEEVLPSVTENPARILGLARKGRLEPGLDADLALLEPDGLGLRHLVAGGRLFVREGRAILRGAFAAPEGEG